MEDKQIKSRDRVKDLAEVYTNEREVNAMLDLLPDNASEEDLRDIINNAEPALFIKATGITSSDFEELIEVGIVKVDSMDGYIKQFKKFEDSGFEEFFKYIFKEDTL